LMVVDTVDSGVVIGFRAHQKVFEAGSLRHFRQNSRKNLGRKLATATAAKYSNDRQHSQNVGSMRNSRWVRLLAYVTGSVNQELLLRNEYLAAENRILRTKLPVRLRLSDPERITLGEIGKRLGRKALRDVACVAKPDTILAWYRRLVAQKFDGSKHRQYPGRPPVSSEVEALVVRMARENLGGAMTASSVHSPTSAIGCRIRP
jgi:hypothetical protein